MGKSSCTFRGRTRGCTRERWGGIHRFDLCEYASTCMSHAPCTSSWPLTQSTVAARTLDALRRPSSTPPAGQEMCAGEWGSWSRAITSSYHHLAGPSACRRTKSSSVALAELARELAASDSSYALKPVAGEGPGKVHAPEALCRRAAGPHSVESVSKKLRSLV